MKKKLKLDQLKDAADVGWNDKTENNLEKLVNKPSMNPSLRRTLISVRIVQK